MVQPPPIALSALPVTVLSVPLFDTDAFTVGLDDAQGEAVLHSSGPLLVLAGPGSGKTRALTHRIARLVAAGVPAYRILALTFTNRAASEMRYRLAGDRDEKTGLIPDAVEFERMYSRPPRPGLLPPGLLVPSSIATFHSMCLRTLRIHAKDANLPPGFSVFDVADSVRVVESVEEDLEKREAQSLFEQFSALRNFGVLSPEALLSPSTEEVVASLRFDLGDLEFFAAQWGRYRARMQELGALDFDDLLVKMLEFLRSPAGESYGSFYDAILVDEFQDTNFVQFEILRSLVGPDPASRDVCVVGDPEQAIFGWRGGSPAMMERFVEVFDPVRILELGTNYRSSPEIVKASQRILDASSAKIKITKLRADPGKPTAISPECNFPPRVVVCEDSDDEAERAAAAVKQCISRGESAAILVRTKAQTRPFEAAFDRLRIPFNLVGATRFVDRTEVKDALSYLHVVSNPANDPAFERAVVSPRRGVGKGALDKLRLVSSEFSLRAKLADAPALGSLPNALRGKLSAFANLLDEVESASQVSPYEAVQAVFDGGLRESFASDAERLANLDELLAAAKAFGSPSGDPKAVLADFLGQFSLSASTDETAARRASRATIITAHAAKGTEFDHVWVAGLDEDVFPHIFASSLEELEEERRLLYVATSRPRLSLTVSHRTRRIAAGRWQDSRPSPFLNFFTGDRLGTKSSLVLSGPDRSNPDVPKPAKSRLTPEQAPPGTEVMHDVFGPGLVVALAGTVARIRFSAPSKERTIDLSFAPLSLV